MIEVVNTIVPNPEPVEVNFWWDETGPLEFYTFDGEKYPYTTGEHIERYIMHTTELFTTVEFRAIFREGHEFEEREHEHVVTPPGVEAIEYIWEFGDGTQGFGPFVTHEYRVEESVEVKLIVVDSRGLIWSKARPMNLASHRSPGYPSSQGFLRTGAVTQNPTLRTDKLILKGSLAPKVEKGGGEKLTYSFYPHLRLGSALKPILHL